MSAAPPGAKASPATEGPASVQEAAGSVDRASLTRGVQWTASAQAIRILLQFLVAIVLARLLAPSEFGLLAMASAVIAIVSAVQTLGTHGPLIQREQLDRSLVDTVFWLNLGLAGCLAGVVFLSAPLVAAMYRTPEVEPLIRVISLALVLYALSGVPGALLRRRLRFDAIAGSATLGAVLYAACAIGLAWAGYGVWSLAYAMLLASATEAAYLTIAARHWPRPRFDWQDLRSIAGYSANMTGVNLLHLVLQNADSLVIGRWLGAGALGMYGMATRFARQPVDLLVSAVLGPVLFPAYSRMQHDDALTVRTVRRALAGATFVLFPVLGGLAGVSRPFVDGVLGPQWSPAAMLIVLMVPIGMMRAMLATATSIFLARDRTRLYLMIKTAGGLALISAFLVGAQFSLLAVVSAVLVAEVAIVTGELTICARLVGTRLTRLIGGARGPFAMTAVMGGIVYALDQVLAARGWSDLVILALAVPTGVLVYAGLAVATRSAALADLLDLLPGRLSRPIRRLVPFAVQGNAD